MNNKTITYVFGYVGDNGDGTLKALTPDNETEVLFDVMKLANVANTNIAGTNGLIVTKAYAIQTLNVLETNPNEGNLSWNPLFLS